MNRFIEGDGKVLIHVNINNIRHNAKNNDSLPCCRVQLGKETVYGDEVSIDGPSRLVYRPNDPLSCGAKVWIETEANVIVYGVRAYNEKAK